MGKDFKLFNRTKLGAVSKIFVLLVLMLVITMSIAGCGESPAPTATPNPTVSTAEQGFKIADGMLIKYSGDEKNVVIPEGVTTIEDNAFSACESIEKVTIANSVLSIGN